MWLARWFHQRVGHPLLAFALPTACFGCDRRLGRHQLDGACLDCWTGFRFAGPGGCPGCGLPPAAVTDLTGPARGRCARCVAGGTLADEVRAAVVYDDHARRFLLRAKLGRRTELFTRLGGALERLVTIHGLGRACDLVVPVPSHPLLTLGRGFAPALELARCVARGSLPLRAVLRLRFRSRLVAKRLAASGRRRRADDAIVLRSTVRGLRILLIDDVITSGATVEACVRALRRAGASKVCVVVWARTLPPSPAAFDSPPDRG